MTIRSRSIPRTHVMRSMRRTQVMRSMRRAAVPAAALACLLLGACAPKAAPTVADRAARAQELIVSGNAAYAQGDYRLASKRYAAAAVERKDDPAAYYGMGMALSKLGRDEEARAAYQRERELTQAAGGAALPPAHP